MGSSYLSFLLIDGKIIFVSFLEFNRLYLTFIEKAIGVRFLTSEHAPLLLNRCIRLVVRLKSNH